MIDKIELIGREIADAIEAVVNAHGLDFNGSVSGTLQEIGRPETATGWHFPVGDDPWKQVKEVQLVAREGTLRDLMPHCLTPGHLAVIESMLTDVREEMRKRGMMDVSHPLQTDEQRT